MKLRAMLRQLLFVLILEVTSLPSFSQNVGIGTTTPTEKLEIKNTLRSTLKISSNSYIDTSGLLLSNRNTFNQGTDFYLKSIGEEGLTFSSLSDLTANTSPNSLIIKPNGNIGINTYNPAQRFEVTGNSVFNGFVGLGATPSVRLEIAGAMKLQGSNAFEFGSGIAGKEINAGKFGYQVFTADALDIVGAGTNNTNRKIKLWAEGGATIDGPVGIGGSFQVNGDPGVAGQVLTSNGASAPQWKNASFTNNTRFAADIPSYPLGGSLTYTTAYNTNPTDVTINSANIVINRSGLYHIEGNYSFDIIYTSSAPNSFSIYLSLGADGHVFVIENWHAPERDFSAGPGFFAYHDAVSFSRDVYVTAPAVVQLLPGYNAIGGGSAVLSSSSRSGIITGYLISD